MTKYIFVDLDECLFHCRYLGSQLRHAGAYLREHEQLVQTSDGEFYGSSLRPGALDLLSALRGIPDSRVFVLTSSVRDYAAANNAAHRLGFADLDLYCRDNLQSGQSLDPIRFGSGPVCLIDNLPRMENRIKINFLRDIATHGVHYYRVPEYWAHPSDQPLTPEMIQDIVLTINNLG